MVHGLVRYRRSCAEVRVDLRDDRNALTTPTEKFSELGLPPYTGVDSALDGAVVGPCCKAAFDRRPTLMSSEKKCLRGSDDSLLSRSF